MPNGKTVTTRKIDVRSPDGKLISTTIQKTITYGKDPVLPPDSLTNDTIPPKSSDAVQKCKHLECRDEQMSERTELVDLDHSQDLGDGAIYGGGGDRRSNASGTLLLRRSRLVPNIYHTFSSGEDNMIADLLFELNVKRKKEGVSCLRSTDRLMLEAQRNAERMARERRVRLEGKMNVWIGRIPDPFKVVDGWSSEAKGHFRTPGFKFVGVGHEVLVDDLRRPLHLIVAIYE